MTEVRFFDPDLVPEERLLYSIVAARYNGKWLFIRHHCKDTWEIPGGHIEENELPSGAAERELTEETGACEYKLEPVSTYSVTGVRKTGYGRLYFAEILRLGPIHDISEIAEIKTFDSIPDDLTYPDIQPVLFEKVIMWLSMKK